MWKSKLFSISRSWPSVHRHAVYSTGRAVSTTMPAAKVEILRTTFVKPKTPIIGRKECQLISFDLYWLAINYTQWLFTYRSDSKFEEVEEKLKDGLRVVLDNFYPLAGKMGKDKEGILRVEYDDDMNGVELNIAVAEDTQVGDMVEDEGVTFNEFIPYVGVSNFQGLYHSLLAVQLTKLKDGFVLSCSFNHGVVDGISMWQFLKAWAHRCNDPTYVPIKAFHDRTKVRNTRVKVDIPLNSRLVTTTDALLSKKNFSFTESTIDNIKSITGANKYSTFQCMAAHVWRAITRARQLLPEDITLLGLAANLRNMVDPPMPETYFGNLIQPAFTKSSAGVLYCSPPETPAALIQQAIKMLDSKTIDASETEWERNPIPFNPANVEGPKLIFGSSPRFLVYDLDFGWGKPGTVKSGYGYEYDGVLFMQQGKNGGKSIDINICLKNDDLKRLEMDKEFLMQDDLGKI